MNQPADHIAIYYDQHAPLWAQCLALIETFQAQTWHCIYIQDEHPNSSIRAGLQAVFKPSKRKLKKAVALEPAIVASGQFGFQNAPVRVAPIMAAFRAEVTAALERGAAGVLFLVEMTWAIRTPSGAVYLREYEAAIHELTLELQPSNPATDPSLDLGRQSLSTPSSTPETQTQPSSSNPAISSTPTQEFTSSISLFDPKDAPSCS